MLIKLYVVAPFVGAWIETHKITQLAKAGFVAPFVGAWIETQKMRLSSCWHRVAPFVGAWIETLLHSRHHRTPWSLPSWERGLKPFTVPASNAIDTVAPFVGAWIETSKEASVSPSLPVAPFVGAWIETLRIRWEVCF